MLVLGRKPGEYVMIGDDIMVKVVRSDRVICASPSVHQIMLRSQEARCTDGAVR